MSHMRTAHDCTVIVVTLYLDVEFNDEKQNYEYMYESKLI